MTKGSLLITGGARRLGRELALHAHRLGYGVVVHHQRSVDEAAELVNMIRGRGGRAHSVRADLASPSETEALVGTALALAPDLEGVVHNASVFRKGDLSDDALFSEMMRVHVGAVREISVAFRRLKGTGRIVALLDAQLGWNADYAAYRFSKRAQRDLVRTLALAWAPDILVHAIAPGPILPAEDDPGAERFARTVARVPLRRSPGPEGILRAFEFLLCHADTTGQILQVDGGQHLLQN